MTAPAHPRSTRPAQGSMEIRLPWWSIALPAVAFAALLLLMTGTGQAQATAGDPTMGRILMRVSQVLTP